MTTKRMPIAPCAVCGRDWPHSTDLHVHPSIPPRTPTTAAGQRFCEGPRPTGNWWKGVPDQIADIEAEAVAAERARIRAAVEDVPWSGDPYCCGELRAAVLALLDPRP